MGAPKSLLRHPNKLCVDEAKNAHNCQRDSRHRISGGDKRLKVYTDARSPDHYCVSCGLQIIQADMRRLDELGRQLR